MAERDVKVLGGWASPFVMRALIALNIKSVRYQSLELDNNFRVKSDLLVKSNPVYKKVPVLIHGEKAVCESLVIVQYIDEVWSAAGYSILPSDPYDRATHCFWAAYVDGKWFPTLSSIAKSQVPDPKKGEIEELVEGLILLEEAYVKCSNGKPFFGGDRVGYLDITLGCFIPWLRVVEKTSGAKLLDGAKIPGLVKWAEKFCADAAVKDVLPETDKLLELDKCFFLSRLLLPIN